MATITERLALAISSQYTIMVLASLVGALICETYKEMSNGVVDNWYRFLFEIFFSSIAGLAVAIIIIDILNIDLYATKCAMCLVFSMMGHKKVIKYMADKY